MWVWVKLPMKALHMGDHPAAPIPRHDLALAQILEERPEVVPSVNRLDKKPLGQNVYRNIGIYQIIYP